MMNYFGASFGSGPPIDSSRSEDCEDQEVVVRYLPFVVVPSTSVAGLIRANSLACELSAVRSMPFEFPLVMFSCPVVAAGSFNASGRGCGAGCVYP